MKISTVTVAALVLLGLAGCVPLEPSPYYGGTAPYYATALQPAYASGEVGIAYYPSYTSAHSPKYRADYWHHQRAPQRAGGQPHAPAQHNAPQRGGQRHEEQR